MSPVALLVLLLAAIIHALWNLLVKRSADKQAFLWLALVVMSVVFALPFAALYRPIPPAGWGLVAVSGALEVAYFVLLGRAYASADLSQVYPLARGSAILFVTLLAALLLGERIAPLGGLGILLILIGVYVVHLRGWGAGAWRAPLLALRDRPAHLALLTGLTVAGYSLVDKVGIRYVDPAPYLYLVLVIPAVVLAPYMLIARRAVVRHEWTTHRWAVLAVSVMFVIPFGLALFVMTTTPVSYVSPVREVSIVFGAVLGTLVLREPFGGPKIAGALLIFLGILCVGLAPP